MRLNWTCGLLMFIIYLMDFLYFQRGLESRPCRETPYKRCMCITVRCIMSLYVNPL
jgi:hypothetical protein